MDEDLLQAAVAATLAKVLAQQEIERHTRAVRLAIWQARNERTATIANIAAEIRSRLLAAGLSEDEIKGAGVSYDSVALIVRGERP